MSDGIHTDSNRGNTCWNHTQHRWNIIGVFSRNNLRPWVCTSGRYIRFFFSRSQFCWGGKNRAPYVRIGSLIKRWARRHCSSHAPDARLVHFTPESSCSGGQSYPRRHSFPNEAGVCKTSAVVGTGYDCAANVFKTAFRPLGRVGPLCASPKIGLGVLFRRRVVTIDPMAIDVAEPQEKAQKRKTTKRIRWSLGRAVTSRGKNKPKNLKETLLPCSVPAL